jgi:hypothetical protein
MPPSEAMQLSIPQAMFFLASRERMEKACRRMNRISEYGDDDPARVIADVREFKRQLRGQFTGSAELELTAEEQRRASQVRHWEK